MNIFLMITDQILGIHFIFNIPNACFIVLHHALITWFLNQLALFLIFFLLMFEILHSWYVYRNSFSSLTHFAFLKTIVLRSLFYTNIKIPNFLCSNEMWSTYFINSHSTPLYSQYHQRTWLKYIHSLFNWCTIT